MAWITNTSSYSFPNQDINVHGVRIGTGDPHDLNWTHSVYMGERFDGVYPLDSTIGLGRGVFGDDPTQSPTTSGTRTVAIGEFSCGFGGADWDVCVGAGSGGRRSVDGSRPSGGFSVMLGANAMNASHGADCVAVGYGAMYGDDIAYTSIAPRNVAIGRDAAAAMTTAADNVVIGFNAGAAMTNQTFSVVIGSGQSSKGSNTNNIGGCVFIKPGTVAQLPAASAALLGARGFVTDNNQTVILSLGLAAVGGGVNKVPVYCDGAAWLVG